MINKLWEKLRGFGRWVKRNTKKTIAVITTIFVGTAVAATILLPNGMSEDLLLKGDVLSYETRVECVEWEATSTASIAKCLKYEDRVSYLYVSNKEILPRKDEDVSKRTRSTRSFKIGETEDGERWTMESYSGEPFYKNIDKWYQTETATTTLDAFNEQVEITWLQKLWGKTAWAATVTSSAQAGDGRAYKTGDPLTWQVAHDINVGSGNTDTDTFQYIVYVLVDGTYAAIQRGLFSFYTPIPVGATDVTSTLRIYLDMIDNTDPNYDFISIMQTSQASTSSLENADYSKCGATSTKPAEGSSRIDISTLATGANYIIRLNATGTSWINKLGEASPCGSGTAHTCLGLRLGNDILDITITDTKANTVKARMSEYTGVTSDPMLTMTFTIPVAEGKGYIKIDKGNIRINKGRLKID